jgi:PAS domain S-box-containing protein
MDKTEESPTAHTGSKPQRRPQRRAESAALHRITEILAGGAEPFDGLEAVAEEVASVFDAPVAAVLILGEGVQGQHLALSDSAIRSGAESLFAEQMHDPDGWLEVLRRQGFRLTVDDLQPAALPPGWAGRLPAEQLARLLVVPLVVRGDIVGGLAIARGRSAGAFDESDVWLAEDIANVLALSVGMNVHTTELDHFFAASLDKLCMIDSTGRLHRLNPRWYAVLGYEPNELEGLPFLDLVHPDDRALTLAAFDDLYRARVPAQFVNRFRAKDGSYHSMEWLARPGTDLVHASGRDITARLAQEQALRESESRLRDLVLTTGDWMWEIDTIGRYTAVWGKVEDVIGYTAGEVIGRTPLDFLLAEEVKRLAPLYARMTERREGCAAVISRNVHKDGHEVVLLTACVPIFDAEGDFAGFRGVDKDVTTRERLGRALQESEDRYRLIAENSNDVICVLDTDTMTLDYVSPSIERLTGFTPGDLIGRDLGMLLPPGARERARRSTELHREAFDTGNPEAGHYLIETEFARKEGGSTPVELSVRLMPDRDGKACKHVSLCRDISQRKAAERALSESRKRIEDLMFVVGDWIWEADAEFQYTQCSAGVRAVLGYEPEEVIGRRPWDFMSPKDAEEMRLYALQRAARKQGCGEVINRNFHRDGREVVLMTSCVPILDDSGELLGFRGIDKDITIASQTQESLHRSVVELNALWQIAETVAGPADLGAALNSVTKQIADGLEARFALVVTFGEGREGRNIVASNSADTAWYEDLFLQRAQQHLPDLAKLSASGEPVVMNEMFSGPLPRRMAERVGNYGFSRMLIIPLVLQTQVIGALVVTRGSDGPPFSERDVEFARAAEGSVAAAVVHARLRVEENLKTINQVRDHLARELHDAVTQSVYSASLIAQALPAIWQRSPEEGLAGLGQLQRLVRSALAELRILLYELRPGTLAGVGLDQLLSRLGDSLAGQADVSVKIESTIGDSLPAEVKEALYRIAQEAFNNIAKHARAKNVRASAVVYGRGVFLEVEDDGVGMDPGALEGDHMGLAIMRERAEEIGAEFRVDTIEPHGTRLSVRWDAPEGILEGADEEGGR